MITNLTALPLPDLERIAYNEQNALALACLEVSEGEGIDPDDYERMEMGLAAANDQIDELDAEVARLSRENTRLQDDLDDMTRNFEESQDELATVRAELEELRARP